jgi:hypothetical protein
MSGRLDELARCAAGPALGLQRRVQEDGGGRGIHGLAAGARVVAAGAQRRVRGGGGEPFVHEPYRQWRDAGREVRRELARGGGGGTLSARQGLRQAYQDLNRLLGCG